MTLLPFLPIAPRCLRTGTGLRVGDVLATLFVDAARSDSVALLLVRFRGRGVRFRLQSEAGTEAVNDLVVQATVLGVGLLLQRVPHVVRETKRKRFWLPGFGGSRGHKLSIHHFDITSILWYRSDITLIL